MTNSSSSSYVCEICGRTEVVYDSSVLYAGFIECQNGHIFCEDHMRQECDREYLIKGILSYKYHDEYYHELTRDNLEEREDYELIEIYREMYEGLPEECCPICSFEEYSEEDMALYLEKTFGISRDEVFEQIKKYNKRRKKLYDSEYITYVCQKKNVDVGEIAGSWKDKFGTYSNFRSYICKNS